ncbi:MAG: hypothetical protein ACRDQ4_01100 [Pseudonocardiaceae bacterium]
MLSPIVSLLRTAVEVQSSLALFERIFTYLDLPHDIIDAPDAMELPPQRALGAISFRDVSFRYPSSNGSVSGRWVLKDLAFHVEPGQFAAVVGPTG